MDGREPAHHTFPLLVRDLNIPDVYVPQVEAIRKTARLRSSTDRLRFDESIRLRIHFGGMHVACLETPEGTKVLAAGFPGTGVLGRELRRQPESAANEIRIESPRPWNELMESLNERSRS